MCRWRQRDQPPNQPSQRTSTRPSEAAARASETCWWSNCCWSTGLRVSEIARLSRDDVNLSDRFVVVRTSKTGKPRLAPLSDQACRLIRRHQTQADGRLLGMSSNAIQQLMKRLDAPSPHAWRRGWAVYALKRGISQVSVQTAAGWSSGAMVTRYTAAMSSELAVQEFTRSST